MKIFRSHRQPFLSSPHEYTVLRMEKSSTMLLTVLGRGFLILCLCVYELVVCIIKSKWNVYMIMEGCMDVWMDE